MMSIEAHGSNGKRICLVIPDLRGGGAERVCIDLAVEFKGFGYLVDFVLLKAEGDLLEEASLSSTIINLDCSRIRQFPVAFIRYLKNEPPDAVLVAMWPLTVLAPLAAKAARYNGPVITSEHCILSKQYSGIGFFQHILLRFSMAIGYRMASANVAVSKGVADDLSRLSKLNRDRFETVYNPIRSYHGSVKCLDSVERMWHAESTYRIVSVGRFKSEKNHALLLKAFACLTNIDASLMLVGDGPLKKELERLAVTLGVENRVTFAGFQKDPAPFYMSANLFVLSSDYEGFGNVIVEALSHGVPVVSTDCPSGPAEILNQGEFGSLVPVNDESALAKAIQAALTSPYDPEKLKKRARDFLPELAARKYINLIEQEVY